MVIMIEGARNVGKTFLLSKLDEKVYKFPFTNYTNEIFTKQNTNYESFKELNTYTPIHYASIGTDIAVLELDKQNMFKDNIITDRNFLSSLVFGIQSKRITYQQAIIEGKYIVDNYNKFKIVLIFKDNETDDDRNKDRYKIYKYSETVQLYNDLINDIGLNDNVVFFNNTYDDDAVLQFKSLINNI